jgi:hypothetical protein
LAVALAALVGIPPQAAPIRSGIAQTFSGPSTPSGQTTTATAQPALGPYTFNKELLCSNCPNRPLRVFIQQVTINNNTTQQNTTWTVKVLNNGGDPQIFTFPNFTLDGPLCNNSSCLASGSFLTANATRELAASQPVSGTVTFSFIPNKGETYKLTATLRYTSGSFPDVNFDSTPFTF